MNWPVWNPPSEFWRMLWLYLSADGGTWIQGAGSAIPRICMALDEFQLSKYLLKMTAFLQDNAYDARQNLKKTLRENDGKKF